MEKGQRINMNLSKFLKKERTLWHKHFIPSILAGLIVAFISLIYEMTVSNILLFASVGASAVILTNRSSHHLTKLFTVISAYFIAIFISIIVYYLNMIFIISMPINLFLLISIVGLCLFLFNSFHPPAITAAVSFILLGRPIVDLVYLFLAIILLLILIRFIAYVSLQNLPITEFFREFELGFNKRVKKSLG
jgi:CBS-domain-containing membrane protein